MNNLLFSKKLTDKINVLDYNDSEDLFCLDFSYKRKKYRYMKWTFFDLGKLNILFEIESLYLNKNDTLILINDIQIIKLIEEIENEK